MNAQNTARLLRASIPTLEALADFSHQSQYTAVKDFAQEIGFKNSQVFGTIPRSRHRAEGIAADL